MARTEERDRVRERLDQLRRTPQGDTDDTDGTDKTDHDDGPATPDWLRFEPAPPRAWLPERLRGARAAVSGRAAAALGVVAVLAAVVAGFSVLQDRPVTQEVPRLPLVEANTLTSSAVPTVPTVPTVPAPEAEELVVSVVGLVRHSGLVRLPPGARVADAIAAAGGAQEGADLLSLNMAQRVSDGDQILVGVAATDGGPPVLGSATVGAGGATPGTATPTGKVNLNTATEAELDALPGVGPVTAAAIVAWRDANGRFADVEQLGEVDGIGPSRLAKLRDMVTV
ncbi:MAG TPA: ComEA family DNA-binding protein [Aldersonia sp.]